jgi:hypothetical protein
MNKIFILLTLVMSFNGFALDHTMMLITNEEDSEIVKFVLETDSDNAEIQAMRKITLNKNHKVIDLEIFHVRDVMRDGAVMSEGSGRKVVILRTKSGFNITNGGNIRLDYLYNGITGKRKDFNMVLKRVGNTWKNFKGSKAFKQLHFVTNKKAFIGAIGVKEIKIVK